jgi:hypothetical protein
MATLGVSDVHYYHSTMSGAPVFQRTVGCMIAVLDACLINGFGSQLPQGSWQKVYTGTNKAVYRSTDTDGTQRYLRVDDTSTSNAKFVGYEAMTNVDTGTGAFPTSAQITTGYTVEKPFATRKWTLFADSRAFYIFVVFNDPIYDYGYDNNCAFGDIVSYIPGDAYHCHLVGWSSEELLIWASGRAKSGYFPRSYAQTGTSVLYTRYASRLQDLIGQGGGVYPPAAGNQLIVSPVLCHESSRIRGQLPGLYSPFINLASYTAALPLHGTIVENNVRGFENRKFFLQSISRAPTNSFLAAIDITGPWRDDGSLSIEGKVTEKLVPGAYRVQLYRQSDMGLLKTTWSAANGDYSFTGLKNQKYVVVAVDHTDPLRSAAIKSDVIPS